MAGIAGTILTISDQPIPDATVMIVAGPAHTDLAAITDGSGQFEFGDLTPGSNMLQVVCDGFQTVSGQVPVRARRITRCDITLQSAAEAEIESEAPRGRGPVRPSTLRSSAPPRSAEEVPPPRLPRQPDRELRTRN